MRSPSCEPTTRPTSCEPRLCGQIRPVGDSEVVDARDAVGAGDVGWLAGRVAVEQADDGLERLVHRAHERDARRAWPRSRSNVSAIQSGYDSLSAPSGSDASNCAHALGEAAHDGVREWHGALEPRAPHELDRLVRGGMRRGVRVAELVRAEPECGADGRVELARRPLAERVDRVVERTHPLHGAVGESLRKGALTLIEVFCGAAEDAVGVGVLFEDAQQHLIRDAPRGRDRGHQRRPRR